MSLLSNNIGVLVGDRTFTDSVTSIAPDIVQFQVKLRSSFSASLNLVNGNADLELLNSGGTVLRRSNNPGRATDAIVQTLDPGTYTIRISTDQTTPTTFGLSLNAQFEFGANLIWRNAATDETAQWTINSGQLSDGQFFQNMPQIGKQSDWKLIDAIDLDTQGNRTLVWRNEVIDQTAVWQVAGDRFITGSLLSNTPKVEQNSNWKLVNASLVDQNLKLLWRNQVSDETAVWNFNGDRFVSGSLLSSPKVGSNSNWQLIDAIDIGSNSRLIWRNAVTDETAVWNYAENQFLSGFLLKNTPKVGSNSDWKLIAATDFNNSPLLLWRNAVTDQTGAWVFDGNTFLTGRVFSNLPSLGSHSQWQLVGLSARSNDPTPIGFGNSSDRPFNLGTISGVSNYSNQVASSRTNYYRFTLATTQKVTFTLPTGSDLRTQYFQDGLVYPAVYNPLPLNTPLTLNAGTYSFQVINVGTSQSAYEFVFEPVVSPTNPVAKLISDQLDSPFEVAK